jgi:hypothetical protein
LLKQRLQVVLKIAIVGQARFGLIVEAHLDITIRHLELARETGQRSQPADSVVFRGGYLAQAQKGLTQRKDSRRSSRPANSGGGVPAPGEKGLRTGSMWAPYIEIRKITRHI